MGLTRESAVSCFWWEVPTQIVQQQSAFVYGDHAEQVAIWILKDDEVIILFVGLRMAGSSQLKEPLHLTRLVFGVEVKVQPIPTDEPLRILIQGEVRISPFRVPKDHPAAFSWLPWNIVKGPLPERQHSVEVDAVDDDGADLQTRQFVQSGSLVSLPRFS